MLDGVEQVMMVIAQPRALPLGAWLRRSATSSVPVLPLRNRSASVSNISTEAPTAASIAAINSTEILDAFALVYSTLHPLENGR